MAYIESIKLSNFRNYESLELSFDKGTNIFYGDNAQGKTNILESVYLCGTSKSHKGSKDREIIRFEQDEAHIRMMVGKDSMSYKIDMHLRKNKAKGVAINGLPIKKARELLGVVNLVFFSPEDLTQTLTRCNPVTIQNYLTLQQAIAPFRYLLVMWLVLNTFISVWQIWKPIKRTLWKIRLITPLLWKALKQKLMI